MRTNIACLRRSALPIAAIVSLWTWGQAPVWAATLQFDAVTAASATAGALHTDLTNQGHDLIVDGSRTKAIASANTSVGAADATAWATAGGNSRFGRLAGSAAAQSDLGTQGDSAGAEAKFGGLFSDVLTIGSSALAPGTPVTVRLGALGHFLAQHADSPGSTGSFDMHLDTDQGSIIFHDDLLPLSHEFKGTSYLDYATTVGGQVSLTGVMAVVLDALSDTSAAGNRTNSVSLDATSTGLFSVKLLTAGATYTAESGTTYLSAVPVPPAWPLLASALAVLGFMRRRRC